MQDSEQRECPAALVLDNVYAEASLKRQAGGRVPPQLAGISAVVNAGESVGILGQQCDGVSVLMQSAAGLIMPKDGAVLVRSQPAQISAATAFSPEETLRTNVEQIAMSRELNGAKLKKTVRRILARLDLVDLENELCKDIEPVDIERVRLAATLLVAPALILIDEPLARGRALLDTDAGEGFDRFLRTGGALLLAGSDPTVMRRVCQRIIWLKDGEVIMDATAAVVARDYARLEEAKEDRIKVAQLYRRFAQEYTGVKVVTQKPSLR